MILGPFAAPLRRRERRVFPAGLKKARRARLKCYDKPPEADREIRRRACRGKPQAGKAFSHLGVLGEPMKATDATVSERELEGWCGWVSRSRILKRLRMSWTDNRHWDGIGSNLRTRVNTGEAEAANGIIRTVKPESRGFRIVRPFTAMMDLVASRLELDLPDPLASRHALSC